MCMQGTHQEISIPETVEALTTAGKVLIVPGYGLAVANAQHSIAELTKMLKKKGVEVRPRLCSAQALALDKSEPGCMQAKDTNCSSSSSRELSKEK